MSALYVLLATLGTYRAAHLVAIDEGPFSAFTRLRYLAGQKTWVGRGLHCVLCSSFWLALVPAVFLAHDVLEFALLWAGIAGGALVIHKGIYK